jgi:hypothetical protein
MGIFIEESYTLVFRRREAAFFMARCVNRFTRSTREEGEPSAPVVEVATGVGVRRTTSSTLPLGGVRGGESRDQ